MLGFCYYKGQGFARDDQAAMGWFLKAAEQGDKAAQKMYFNVKLNGYANDGRHIPETIFNQFHSFGHGESVDVCSVNKTADGGLVVLGRLNWVGGMLNPSGWTDFNLLVGKEGNFQSFSLIKTTGLTKSETAVMGGVCLAAGVIAALCSDPPPAQNPIFIQQNTTVFQQQNNTLRVNVY
jgi:hypothetical protein